MHDLAVVSRIQKIEPIENKDRIVLATVSNYNTIVAKDEFNVGDLVVYCFYDSILPNEERFEFLRKRCWSEKYQGFRIQPMKMGGKVSEGLVLSMDYLPKDKEYKEGDIVTDDLKIRRYNDEVQYEPKKKKQSKFKCFLYKHLFTKSWFRTIASKLNNLFKVTYGDWFFKSDEENIEKVYDEVKDLDLNYILTEKIEGQAVVYVYNKGKIYYFSHNVQVDKNSDIGEYAKISNLNSNLKKYCKKNHIKKLAVCGELVGQKIQKNIYGLTSLDFYMYNGFSADGKPLSWYKIKEVAEYLNIKTVPYLSESKVYELDKMLADCEGKSKVADTYREGIVWRTVDGKHHFKVKSRNYKVWFNDKK